VGTAARVRALASGADDFLALPFAVEEFVARAHALLRRSGRFTFGPLRVDMVQRTALLGHRRLVLTPREFDLLAVLVRNAGMVATRGQLIHAASRDEPRRSNWLDVHMNALRQKLGKHAHLVETVRGAGYRLRSPR
jgi:two-component system alkaline phosphatase synthesis response regulator PhoP